jgi:hypothetical protein
MILSTVDLIKPHNVDLNKIDQNDTEQAFRIPSNRNLSTYRVWSFVIVTPLPFVATIVSPREVGKQLLEPVIVNPARQDTTYVVASSLVRGASL